MNKLSPQKELIVSTLRDLKWHCGREWLNQIKDDRKRISELNEGYIAEKGYQIVGEPCKGTICGVKDCPLFKRKATKIGVDVVTSAPSMPKIWEGKGPTLMPSLEAAQEKWFESLG